MFHENERCPLETNPGSGQLRKRKHSGRTAERWTQQVAHPKEATLCPDQGLGAEVTLHIPHPATPAFQGAMEDLLPTKTLN